MLPYSVVLLSILAGSMAYDASSAFDASFSRNYMLKLAAAAFSDTQQKCLKTISSTASVIKAVNVPCDFFKDNCAGYVAVIPSSKALVVSFRGTAAITQLIDEITATAAKPAVPLPKVGKVGPYFMSAFNAVWTNGKLKEALVSAIAKNSGYELWVTGQSLGASMAAISAAVILQEGLFPASRMRLMTFGEPRTGDKAFSAYLDQQLLNMHRVVHRRDLVVHIPYNWMGYYHQRQEIFYNNEMTDIHAYKVCKGDEDATCSNSQVDLSVPDHTTYFNIKVSSYGKAGCVVSMDEEPELPMSPETALTELRVKEGLMMPRVARMSKAQ